MHKRMCGFSFTSQYSMKNVFLPHSPSLLQLTRSAPDTKAHQLDTQRFKGSSLLGQDALWQQSAR